MPKRPDYGDATPDDLARALLRPAKGRGPEPPPDGAASTSDVADSHDGTVDEQSLVDQSA